MGTKIGYLDKNGHPNVKIKIWGMAAQFAQEFDAMIDTGFTGFLSMPLTAAFPLALTLFGTTSYTLADGSISPKLLGYGTVELQGEQAQGSIVLEPNSAGLLLGMEFLRGLNKALVLSPKNGVVLTDDPDPDPVAPEVPPPAIDPPNPSPAQ